MTVNLWSNDNSDQFFCGTIHWLDENLEFFRKTITFEFFDDVHDFATISNIVECEWVGTCFIKLLILLKNF